MVDTLRAAYRLGKNVVVLDAKTDGWEDLNTTPPENRRIDVWWWCDDATCQLMLLLAYLMTRSETVGKCKDSRIGRNALV